MDSAYKIKLGFKKIQIIYSAVIILGILHAFTPLSLLKSELLVAVVLSALLMICILIYGFKDQITNLIIKEKKEPILVPEILIQAKRLGIKMVDDPIWITNKKGTGSTNPYTKQIKLNKNFYEKLNHEELIFVVGHELGHLTKKFSLIPRVIIPPMILSLFFSSFGMISNIVVLPIFAALIITFNFITRWEEFKADEIGASMVSKEDAINALKKALSEKGLDRSSATHPSANERIRNLEKFYRNN